MIASTDSLEPQLLSTAPWLRAVARRLVTASDVEDVVQATWLAALRRGTVERPMLAGIARRVAAMLRRGEARRRERERRRADTALAPSTIELVERLETMRRLAAAICALPEPYRTTVLQHHELGIGITELASREGVNEANIRKRLQRGRELVRLRLANDFGGEQSARGALLAVISWPGIRRSMGATAIAGAAVVAAGGIVLMALSATSIDRAPPAAVPAPAVAATQSAASIDRALSVAAADDYALVREQVVVQEPAPSPPHWTLRVTVHDAKDQPVANVGVRFGTEARSTAADGTCEFTASGSRQTVPDWISASMLPQSSSDRSSPRWWALHEGLRRSLPPQGGEVAIDLKFTEPAPSIAGRVLDAAGQPAPSVTVFLADAAPLRSDPPKTYGNQPIEDLATCMEGEAVYGEGRCQTCVFAITDADGNFVLQGLRERAYQLRAIDWRDARTAVSSAIEAGTRDALLRLPAADRRRFRGIVVDPAGRPLEDVEVTALVPLLRVGDIEDFFASGSTRTAVDGTFELQAAATSDRLAVRSETLLPTTVLVAAAAANEGNYTICTDQPHAVHVLSTTAWPQATSCEVLDVREHALPLFAPGKLMPPRANIDVHGAEATTFVTRGDAVMLQLLRADGTSCGKVPLRWDANGVAEVR